MRVVVIGAGAAGTMAAIFAASAGAETRLLERTKDGGRKILISGGGRCNILPASVDHSRFVTDSSSQTLRKILRSWPLVSQIAFFENDARIPLMEEADSAKLFPKSESARSVRDALFALARAKGVTLETGSFVTGLSPAANGWTIQREAESPLTVDAVIVATGGLSVPHTGSDGGGLRFVQQLGHTVHRTYAALTPLLNTNTTPATRFSQLSGISLPVTLSARASHLSAMATGGFLFTHRGYSGPSVLDVSHVAVRSLAETNEPARITVQWTALNAPAWEEALRPRGTRTVLNELAIRIPLRLAETLLQSAAVDRRRTLSNLTRAERLRLVDILTRGTLPWTGDEGYKKAEV